MLEKIRLYDPADLEKVVAKGCKSFPDEAAWVRKLLASFAGIVKRRPQAYRSFGPFWWPLKAMMIKAGELSGCEPDAELVAQATMGRPALDVAAAWSMHETYSSQMLAGSTFTVDTESGDTIEYLLVDDEMKAIAALRA